MKTVIKRLLASKKAIMTVLGVLTTYVLLPLLNGRLQLGLDADQVNEAIYPFIAYVIGQGMADFGKEKGIPGVNVERIISTDDPNETPPA